MLPGPNYEELKKMYDNFKNNPPSKPFDRWIGELKYTTNLEEFAKKANLQEDVVEFSQSRQVAINKLKEMGVIKED